MTTAIDPRLFARFDEKQRRWVIAPGLYRFGAGFDAEHRDQEASLHLGAATMAP